MPILLHYYQRSLTAGHLGGGQLGSLGGRRLSMAEIQQTMRAAGWPDVMFTDDDGNQNPLIVVASATFMGESSGYAEAHNTSGENSCGICQVYIAAHPEVTCQQMFDPAANLRKCLEIFNAAGGSLHPWGAYTGSGPSNYGNFMADAWAAYGGNAPTSTIAGAGGASSSAIAAGVGGGTLLLLGLAAAYFLTD